MTFNLNDMRPDTIDIAEAALSYLRLLRDSGYFDSSHTDCSHLWIGGYPACRDSKTYAAVKDYLLSNGFIVIKALALSEAQRQTIHPRDQNDMWWFELTDKGRDYLTSLC